MNEKKLYKIAITDKNGKLMHEVESDCIIAAISDPSRSTEDRKATHAVYVTDCPTATITGAFEALEKVKREAIAKNPMLGMALAMESLSGLAKKYGVNLDEEDEVEETSHKSVGEDLPDFLADIFKK